MNLLYAGNYYKRFDAVRKLIKADRVVELCFGDTVIADFCKKNKIDWTGYDINPVFVKNAVNKGYNAQLANINAGVNLNSADVCIMSGSFYHFHSDPKKILTKMLKCADQIILSEPIVNLSSKEGIIGKLAKASANVNGKEHAFRFTETSLLNLLNDLRNELKFTYEVAGRVSKDIIIVINKR
jgi:hypothetical protein